MTADLTAQLTALIAHHDTLREVEAPGALDLPMDTSYECYYEVTIAEPEPGTNGPRIKAHADVLPGGIVGEVRLEARYDGEVAAMDVEPDTALHKAVQVSFTDMWDSWDEILEGTTSGEVMGVCVSDLRVGDLVWRLDLTVAGVESGGINTAGEDLVAVYFEDNPGREVWPASRSLTIIRNGDDDHETIKVTRQQVAAARIVRALDQVEGRQSDEWVQRLTQAEQKD